MKLTPSLGTSAAWQVESWISEYSPVTSGMVALASAVMTARSAGIWTDGHVTVTCSPAGLFRCERTPR